MSRFWGYVVITFTDGSTERVGGNENNVWDGVLTVWTRNELGGPARDVKSFPLVNVRSWHWED